MDKIPGLEAAFKGAKVIFMTTFDGDKENTRQMTNYNEGPYGTIWFPTERDTKKVRDIEKDSRVLLTFPAENKGEFYEITGEASFASEDVQEVLDVFQRQLAGVLTAPILQRGSDGPRRLETGNLVTAVTPVAGDRAPADVRRQPLVDEPPHTDQARLEVLDLHVVVGLADEPHALERLERHAVLHERGALAPQTGSILEHLTADSRITCATCHDPHSNSVSPFLRLDNSADALCLDCHRSRNTTLVRQWTGNDLSHPVGIALVGGDTYHAVPLDLNGSPQPSDGNLTNDLNLISGEVSCTTCHGVHNKDSDGGTID